MKLPRRQFLQLAAAASMSPALSWAISWTAQAQSYPTRPVRLVVGYPAGSGPDIPARLVGQWLSQRLGQPFTIDNRPGAAGNVGAEIVAKAEPNGFTLLEVLSTNTINASLYTDLNFDFVHDIAPVGSIGVTPFVMVVSPSLAPKTVQDFIAYARANPGKINMASAGTGTAQHVSGELFKMMTGVELVHVPYRGNYTTDLLNGQVQLAFMPIAQALEYVEAGTLTALAVTTATRSPALPNVPSIGEFVPGYASSGWYGIGAPAGTPQPIVDLLNAAINSGLADATVRSRLAGLGIEPRPMSVAEFSQLVVDDTAKWAKVIKFGGIKPD